MSEIERHLPLTARQFHILLALAESPQNGYQVALRAEESSRGRVRMQPATQYENLHRLASRGLIEETEGADCNVDGRGQRFWRLTDLGEDVLRAEVDRLSADLETALAKPLLQE